MSDGMPVEMNRTMACHDSDSDQVARVALYLWVSPSDDADHTVMEMWWSDHSRPTTYEMVRFTDDQLAMLESMIRDARAARARVTGRSA